LVYYRLLTLEQRLG